MDVEGRSLVSLSSSISFHSLEPKFDSAGASSHPWSFSLSSPSSSLSSNFKMSSLAFSFVGTVSQERRSLSLTTSMSKKRVVRASGAMQPRLRKRMRGCAQALRVAG